MRKLLLAVLVMVAGCENTYHVVPSQVENSSHDEMSGHQDMEVYLEDTEALVEAGDYAEALERYQWFNEHALSIDPEIHTYSGILSWWELGKEYPEALEVFIKERDRLTEKLSVGKGDSDLFFDVLIMNQQLAEESKTAELFIVLDKQHPQLAEDCGRIAISNLIEFKHHELARKYMIPIWDEFDMSLLIYENKINMDIEMTVDGMSFQEHTAETFVKDILGLIAVAVGAGDVSTAKKIQQEALRVVDDERFKVDISEERNNAE